MLLSPINSPSRYQNFLSLPLLIHERSDSSSYGSDFDNQSISSPISSHNFCNELVLPVELIFYIVELACTHRRTAVALCQVASWIRSVVLPSLYNTIICDIPSSAGKVSTDCAVQQHHPIRAVPLSFHDIILSDIYQTRLISPLKYVRALWLDVEPSLAPYSLDSCPRLTQLAIRLEAYATITRSTCWFDQAPALIDTPENSSLGLSLRPICRSFTVLGQCHPHRWAPLTSNEGGRAFLKNITHLRLLNLCLSNYIPFDFTPNLTHICLPLFDLRSSEPEAEDVSSFARLDFILARPQLRMVVLTLNPRYWKFDDLTLKGWAVRAMARDPRLYVVVATRDDGTRDWDVPRRDWENEASGGLSVWDQAIQIRKKFLTRLSRTSWNSN